MSKFPDLVKWHAANAKQTGEALTTAKLDAYVARNALNDAEAKLARAREAHEEAVEDLRYAVQTAIDVGGMP